MKSIHFAAVILVIVAYVVGARYPQLAKKFGIA